MVIDNNLFMLYTPKSSKNDCHSSQLSRGIMQYISIAPLATLS